MQATIKKIERAELPAALREIQNPPERLYVCGRLPAARPVAIVGTRRPTAYGRRIAGLLAARLAAAGVPIVSGLAFGIDTCAHRGALGAGGQTIAILPGGLDRESVSPRSNLDVADRIVETGGALLSESKPGTSSHKHLYASRNRLISGLARAVVVVEATLPSGSLVTAQHAIDQGRDLWAVPGPIDSAASAGTNWLLRDGAGVLNSIDEFLEALGVDASERPADGLLGELSTQPVHPDELVKRSGRSAAEVESELTRLELRGLVRQLEGRYYVRV